MRFNKDKQLKHYEVQKTGRGHQYVTIIVKSPKGDYSVTAELEAGDVIAADPKTVEGMIHDRKLVGGGVLNARLKEAKNKQTTFPEVITEEELLSCDKDINKLRALKGKTKANEKG